MIGEAEVERFAKKFGVPASQVRRDHLISHTLAALGHSAQSVAGTPVFFGGTALCRTWLPDLRLSEDIDLLVNTIEDGEEQRQSIRIGLRSEFPDASWTQVGTRHAVDTWNLAAEEMLVKVQFALWRARWEEAVPQTVAPVQLRYSDLAESVDFKVPTASGFAAMKLLAWLDRHAPRDIYDLAALADAGFVDGPAVDAAANVLGYQPTAGMIANVPLRQVRTDWDSELAHQTADPRSFDDSIAVVQDALRRIGR